MVYVLSAEHGDAPPDSRDTSRTAYAQFPRLPDAPRLALLQTHLSDTLQPYNVIPFRYKLKLREGGFPDRKSALE